MSTARRPGSIAISRNAIAPALWIAVTGAGLSGCSDPSNPSGSPALTMAAVTGTDSQTARTGTTLPLPLRVRVKFGSAPKAGVTVTWLASAGTIVPSSSATDTSGLASATWTLGLEPGTMTVATRVEGADGSPVTFSATATTPLLTATAEGSSDSQTGVVGTVLPRPIRVQVRSDGAPTEGVKVHWQARTGSLAHADSITDGEGFASATWRIDTLAGFGAAVATIAGAQPSSVSFTALGLPGPVVGIGSVGGADQTLPANHTAFVPVIAAVTDRYGNGIQGQTVTWTVESGPVAFLTSEGATDAQGRATAVLAPSGPSGHAVVRAALPGGGASTDFALTVAPPSFGVVLHTGGILTSAPFSFVSSQNGTTRPAVDTLPAGGTMIWTLQFDYDLHGVAAVGAPTFQGGDFPYANPSTISVTFTAPGTYHYADPYNPTATGTVVVQ
jgi:hypothetical protein